MKNILRNFWIILTRFKMASILNIVGLAVAFSVFTIIMMQTYWEFSYNKNFKDYQRIIRLENSLMSSDNRQLNFARPMGDAIGENTPTIEQFTAVSPENVRVMSVSDSKNQVVNVSASIMGATKQFPYIFSLECVDGDFNRFEEPNTAIISQSDAEKMFSNQNPIDKIVWAGNDTMTVVAVYKDLPENCTFENSLIYQLGDQNITNTGNWNYHYYYKLVNQDAVKNAKSDIINALIKTFPAEAASSQDIEKRLEENLYVVPMEDIYFEGMGSRNLQGNKTLTSILIAIAILIIGIAVINFINFFMALVPIRIRSVNINKIFGTPVYALKLNIVGEAFGTVLVAFILSLLFLYGLQTSFISDFMKNSIMIADNVGVIIFSCIIALTVGLLSGLYPAYYITKFPPMMVLRGAFGRGKSGRRLRTTLVVVQYVISIALIIGSMFVVIQTDFLRNVDMGYNRDRLVTVQVGSDIAKQPDAFLDLLKQDTDIEGVAYSNFDMLNVQMGWGRQFKGEPIYLVSQPVSWDYPEFMDFKLVEGRFFTQSDASKASGTMIINQAASKKYGVNVGDFIAGHGQEEAEVVGIVKDYNFTSAKNEIEPIVLYEFGSQGWYTPSIANIRISATANYKDVCNTISSAMKSLNPSLTDEQIVIKPFDEAIESLYQSEDNLSSIISIFSLVAIVISLVGVFGLVVFETQYKRKEIALRKVHGASVASIPIMINKKFIWIVVLGAIIAIPVAYLGVWYWLQSFAMKTPLYWWVGLIAIALVWLITIAIVTFQTVKAATENPIEALKKD